MRDIKFRAWDKTYKRMNYKVQVGNTDYADKNYTCNSIWVDYADNKSVGWMNADDKCIDLMQYTGLKDKNGKEIYEGDILKSESWGKGSRLLNPYHVVKWGNCGWKAEGYNGSIRVSPSLDIKPDFEIIGNIYETPELLNN